MKEILALLEEAIEKESYLKEKNRELNILGIMSDEELKRFNEVHNYAINRINEIHIEVYMKCDKED